MSDRTLVVDLTSSSERTQRVELAPCRVCGTSNSGAETWCIECGFRLNASPGDLVVEPVLGHLVRGDATAYPLRRGSQTIGRHDADVTIASPGISRLHARLSLEPEDAWIEDMGSTNGTFVNDHRLTARERFGLSDGDAVRLGDVALEFRRVRAGVSDPDSLEDEEALEDHEALESQSDASTAPGIGPAAALILPDGECFALADGVTRVGRRSDNDLVLADPFTSGTHGNIDLGVAGLRVVDLGSTNGTFVNGDRIEPNVAVNLQDGDRVAFGRLELIVQHGTLDGTSSTETEGASPSTGVLAADDRMSGDDSPAMAPGSG